MKYAVTLIIILILIGCGAEPADEVHTPITLEQPDFCVVLDFGHGGFDGGAVGNETGVVEAELNLAVGTLVMQGLYDRNVQVILTRTSEDAIGDTKREDMDNRGEILCQEGADIVVSIHMNKFTDRKVRGPMVYYQTGAAEGENLAQSIMDALTQALGREPRLASAGNNFVTRIPPAPAALVECGFLSNHEEELLLQDGDYQKQLADAIVLGIMNYLENNSEQ